MTSSVFSESSSSPLPSGSRWGPKEVAKVRFADDPEDHELREFACKINDSEELSEVRKRLAEIVAVPEEDLKNKDVTREFSQHSRFFGDLAEVLEKPQSPRTPRRSFTRNTKDFDESDDNESTVPGSSPPVSGLQAPTTPSTPSTVGPEAKKQRLVSPETPTPSRLQPNLPTIEDKCREISSPTIARSPEPARTTAEEYEHRRSTAQLLNPQSTPLNSDSTYDQQSTPSSVGSELPAARFQTKTSEQVVNIMFRNFLHVICDEHGNRNGMEFRVREAESLSIPTKGDFPVAIPDWAVSVSLNGHKHVNILDYEGKRQSTKEKYGQTVGELIGRANSMRGELRSPFTPYLLCVRHLEFRIATCTIKESYLESLREGTSSTEDKIPVHHYGPLNMRHAADRMTIVQTVYKLMIHCAERLLRDEKKRKR